MARRTPWVLAAALLGFASITAAFSTEAARRVGEPRREQLVELIVERRQQVEEMESSLGELRAEVDDRNAEIGRRNADDRAAAEFARVLELQAGAAAMVGPGIEVTLSDSERVPAPGDDESLYRVHDIDIQLVVNALLAAGAEAVAVDDQRVVSTTAIRGAGETILVNFRPLIPPYRVTAIGLGPKPFEEHPVARRLSRWAKLFGLGFRVKELGEATVPAYGGRASLRHAEPRRPQAPVGPGRS